MEYEIRKAVPDDAADILAYLKIVGGETDNISFGAEGLPFSEAEERDYIKSLMDSSDGVMVVAVVDGKIVGDASLSRQPRRSSHRGELGISVRKDFWGRGIGSALMGEIVSYAKNHGYAVIDLQVRSDNERAIKLYLKFGFMKIGTHPDFSRVMGRSVSYDYMFLPLQGTVME